MNLDVYFRRPLFWDYFICIMLSIICFILYNKCVIKLPLTNDSTSITSDVTNISLTIAGFILTLLTVLITFKSSSKIKNIKLDNNETIFDLFFATGLYYETNKHLKNCIKSLLFIALTGFGLKLFLSTSFKQYIFFFNIIGLGIIILTMWRCLLILSKVLDLQKETDDNN